MITLDTNAIIDYFQGQSDVMGAINTLRENGENFVISTITEVELFSYPDLTVVDAIRMSIWLSEVHILPVDSVVARHAAELRKRYRLKTPDAIVAATAALNGGKLMSTDKAFRKMKEIRLV